MITITSADNKEYVEIGGTDILKSAYSTAKVRLSSISREIESALTFLHTGECNCKDALMVARQLNLIRDGLASISPDKAIYDADNPGKKAPWEGNISPIVTSCANMYTTADGKDLFAVFVRILSYAYYTKNSLSTNA